MGYSIRRFVATAAGGAAAVIIGSPIAVPAAATTVVPDGSEQLVQVDLHTLDPAAPAPGDRVEITGRITNITDKPLRNVQALLRYDSRPLATRSDITRVTTATDVRWGWRPGHIYDIAGEQLAPGESARFDLEFAVDTACSDTEPADVPCLALPDDGVYAIGVDGNVTMADDGRTTGGTARTVLPWQPGDSDPIPVALLWPVIGEPRIGQAALRDTTTPTAPPDGGSGSGDDPDSSGDPTPGSEPDDEGTTGNGAVPPEIDRLLAAPGDAPVTWAVDPGTWAPSVAEAVDTGELAVVPPSVPDAGMLARTDRSLAGKVTAEVARVQREFTPSADGTNRVDGGSAVAADRMDVAWPGAGLVSEPALQAWASAGYDTVVLPRDAVAMAGRSPVASLETGGDRLSAVLTDPGLGAAIADNAGADISSPRSAALDLRQRWLAETAMAREEVFGSGAGALVAAPPAGWRPSREVVEALLDVWTGAEWITPVTLSSITEAAPRRPDAAPSAVLTPLLAGTDDVPGDYAHEVERLHDELTRYRSLLGDPGASAESSPAGSGGPATAAPSTGRDGRPTATPALVAARAASVTWRNDPDTAHSDITALRERIAGAVAGVSVVVNPSNTLSGNTGVFPVNIANDLAHAVTVRLEFDPANEDRLAIEPVETRVPGGQQQTVQVRAEAVANGKVPVSVQLATVDGTPLGGAQHTIVNATHYGRIGWIVVAGSAVLFAGGLTWRMVRSRRRAGP